MRTLLLALALVSMAFFGSACAAETDPTPAAEPTASAAPEPAAEEVEATIVQLERDWVAAILNRDVAALDRLLAEEFVGTSPSAHIYYKAQALNDLEQGTYAVESMDLDEVSANVFGDTAIAFTSQEEKSKYGPEDTSGHYHYTNVWLNRNGQWQVVSSHGSRYGQRH